MSNLKYSFIRIILGWLTFGLVVFGAFFVISSIPSKLSVSDNINFETKFVKLSEIKSFRGYFVASEDNLNRVDVLFKNPNLESRDEVRIAITDGEKTVYEQNFTGYNFGDTSQARLDFNALANSKNIKYTINIIPTKIVDGKLFFGTKNSNLDMIHYYKIPFNINNSLDHSFGLIQNRILVWPLILFTIFLW